MADDDTRESRESAPPETPPAPPGSRRSRLFALGLLAPLLLACSCGGCSVLARDWLGSAVLGAALATRGISCDALSVEVTLALDRATLGPTTCHAASGSVETVELVDTVTADLVLFSVTHVRTGHLRVALRGDPPSVDAGALGPVAELFRVPERIGLLIEATGEVAAMGPPRVDVDLVEVVRGEHVSVSMHTLRLDGASPLRLSAAEVTLPALEGPLGAHADVRIEQLTGEATADDVTLTGTIHLDGSAPLVGTMHREGEVTVTGAALTSSAPSYGVQL